jgi:Ca2+-binding EF-hand superfamily protein
MAKTLTFGLILTLVVAASAAGQNSRRAVAIRFADMDTNNDRVITRQEWRGSDRSFEVHDWNRDGILSGEEVRQGGRRPQEQNAPGAFESADQEYTFNDWTARGFTTLDHNRDGRVTRDEWHFDMESFRRADHNRDGWLSRAEFLGDDNQDDDRADRFAYLDTNNDGRISRAEWHGTAERFDALDDNRDGLLTRTEVRGGNEPPPDLFASVDVNRDSRVTRDEWHWSAATFDARDTNRDGVLTRAEFSAEPTQARSEAWTRGRERGLADGRQAGKEDKERNGNVWDLEGQRELETADAGYDTRFGPRADYQAGYRDGFRRGYREGFGPRN